MEAARPWEVSSFHCVSSRTLFSFEFQVVFPAESLAQDISTVFPMAVPAEMKAWRAHAYGAEGNPADTIGKMTLDTVGEVPHFSWKKLELPKFETTSLGFSSLK